ncbi:TonB-dependent receptor plug domain-containing protein [Selenomonas noxia]|uniref:TonB-dependent receptor plug domain-containing protein n=1 Tax=Selenomonas noxia TaxID=135083 RepID=UPI0028806692|nr:TonB-dependent receptor [Selenomonas noxia]
MKKSVLSGLITGVLTIVTTYAAPSASAEETTDESTQTYETDAIVITASRSETTISDVPADVTLISGEQIERGNYTSVSDALKGANINVVQKGFASYPIINGDSRVLVMVDGKKVNWDHLMVSGDSNAVDVDQIPIGNVERIEIVHGPNSSLYGERAVSGVINIITKRPTGGTPGGTFSAQLGSWGEKRASVSISGGDGKNSIKVGVAHERRNDFQYKNAYGEKRTFRNSDINRTDYNIGFDRIIGSDRLRLEFSRHEGDDGYGVNLSDPRTGASRYQGRKNVVDTGYGVTYMFGSEKEGEGTFLRFYRNESKSEGGFNSQYDHHLRRNSFEGQRLWMLNDKNMLVGGFLWSQEKIHEMSGYVPMDVSAVTKALFLEDDWQFGHGYSLKLGSRLENHNDFGTDVTSHISLNKKFGRRTHAYISFGQAVNNPTLKMRYANSPFWVGNPDLKQEKSHTFTIGADSQITRKWNVSGSLYWSKVKDALRWVQATPRGYYQNVGTEDRRGLELSTRYRADDRWTIRAAYSYANVDSTDAARAYLSNNTRPNGYNLGLSYTLGKWEADADLNYVTGRSTERFTDSRYLTLDLGVNYHVTKDFKVYLKGMNLTDESYESIGDARLGIYAMPSRHFILGGTYNF